MTGPRQPGLQLDAATEERIRRARRDDPDMTLRQLRQRFGVGSLTIERALRGESTAPKSRASKLRGDTIAAVMQRLADGEPAASIARALGLQPQRVRKMRERELQRQRDARGAR